MRIEVGGFVLACVVSFTGPSCGSHGKPGGNPDHVDVQVVEVADDRPVVTIGIRALDAKNNLVDAPLAVELSPRDRADLSRIRDTSLYELTCRRPGAVMLDVTVGKVHYAKQYDCKAPPSADLTAARIEIIEITESVCGAGETWNGSSCTSGGGESPPPPIIIWNPPPADGPSDNPPGGPRGEGGFHSSSGTGGIKIDPSCEICRKALETSIAAKCDSEPGPASCYQCAKSAVATCRKCRIEDTGCAARENRAPSCSDVRDTTCCKRYRSDPWCKELQ